LTIFDSLAQALPLSTQTGDSPNASPHEPTYGDTAERHHRNSIFNDMMTKEMRESSNTPTHIPWTATSNRI
jgi:hypothetical protein